MTQIFVVWHKNPDTDATLSAIIAADFLTKKWYHATPYIAWELNKETLYLLDTYNIECPKIQTVFPADTEICLVDHNETSQAPDNLSELNVTWLIDHHKIKFETSTPLYMRVEPICSTASILYKMYKESGYEISKDIATMMLACIMSDSLLFRSPTTTQEDKDITKKLQEIAQIDNLEAFAMPMFQAKSDLGDMPAKEVVQYDYKIFEINGKKCGIGSLETTNPWYALWRKTELLEAMKELKAEQDLDFIMLCIVDILEEQNTTIVGNEDVTTLEAIFATHVDENLWDLGNRLSRKKQIAPDITNYFTAL